MGNRSFLQGNRPYDCIFLPFIKAKFAKLLRKVSGLRIFQGRLKTICSFNYEVSFSLYEIIEINGRNAHPLWKWLKKEKPGLLGMEAVK